MLSSEPGILYEVYPSWASFSYKWEDLSRLLGNPLDSGYLNPAEPWEKWGFSRVPKPFELIDGPCGGGIICEHHDGERWLPGVILTKEGNHPFPPGVGAHWAQEQLPFSVSYLEPYLMPFQETEVPTSRNRRYLCAFSAEHINAEPEAQYWVVRTRKAVREIKGLVDLPKWAFDLGPHVSRLPGCPDHLARETADWFNHPDRQYHWYKVDNFQPKAGLCFAIVVYLGLHLAKVAGKRDSRDQAFAAFGFGKFVNRTRSW
jgi:hypothetical protein